MITFRFDNPTIILEKEKISNGYAYYISGKGDLSLTAAVEDTSEYINEKILVELKNIILKELKQYQ